MNEFPEYRENIQRNSGRGSEEGPAPERQVLCVYWVEAYYPVPATGHHKAIDPRRKVCFGANTDGQLVSSLLVTVYKRP